MLKQVAAQRLDAFVKMINDYLNAITTKSYVEAADYLANTRRVLDLTMRIVQIAGGATPTATPAGGQPTTTPTPIDGQPTATPTATPGGGQPTPAETPVPGSNRVTYEPRTAAYVVIRNHAGHVAAVRVPAGYWLPGGGSLPGETPEETIVREVREELGGTLRILHKIGEARQYFFAASEGRYYAMQVVFFRAELIDALHSPAEHGLCWLDVSKPGPCFFHACHDWAVRQSE